MPAAPGNAACFLGEWPMRLGVSILVALLAIPVAGRVAHAEPVRVSTIKGQVSAAVGELKAARMKERTTREAQALLAHRIAALKRLDKPRTDNALLERLLRESVDADEALAAQIEDVRRWQQAVLQAVREAFEQIDARLRVLAPKLSEKNPLAVRQAAAREISELRAVRNQLREELVSAKNDEPHREWAAHVVTIDPLDGPSELADKGDVLELTRKKIEAKKQRLTQLIREKKIAQAARDFSTDASALDDDLRSGRVSRRPGTLSLANEGGADHAPAPPESPADVTQGSRDTDPAAFDEADNLGASAPPPDVDPSRQGGLETGQPQASIPGAKTSVPVTPPSAAIGGPVAKQIDPNLLINLRVDELDADAVDLATLQKLVAELESLQSALGQQAKKIHARAKQLEKDEARAQTK